MSKLNLIFLVLLMFTAGGCGNEKKESLQPSGGGGGGSVTDWSSLGVNTVTSGAATSSVNHADYLVGSHSAYKCADCHSLTQTDPATNKTIDLPRDQICAYCHPYSRYTSVMTSADHSALKAGTHCNACHYSAPGVSGSAKSGWRWSSVQTPKTRVPHAQWHPGVKGTCLNCHTAANEAIPSVHPAITTTTACESCHHYSNGKWGGQHAPYTTGCRTAGCHSGHYSPYNCEWCHTNAAAGGYVSWSLTLSGSHQTTFDQRSCSACHGGGGEGG